MKKRNRILTYLLFIITTIFIFIVIFVLLKINNTNPNVLRLQASGGAIHLDDNILKSKKLLMLNGEWEFYPNQYYYPEDFMDGKVENKNLLQFPGSWKNVKYDNGTMNSNGYGTYRLIIKNDGTLSKELAMLFSAAPAEAYKVYVNGQEAFSIGTPGTNKGNTVQEYKTQLYSFSLRSENEIIIHTCNYSFTLGGFFKTIIIGDNDEVQNRNIFNLCRDYLILGVLTTIALYFGLIWFSNKENVRAEAYLVMVSILSILYTISNNEMLIRTILPHIPFKAYNVIFYVLPICGTSFYIFMMCHLFEEECYAKIKKITIIKSVFL